MQYTQQREAFDLFWHCKLYIISIRLCQTQMSFHVVTRTQFHVGIYLARPVFSHRQLCVLMSRVTTHEGLKIFICSEDGNNSNITLNVVYRKVFQNFNKVMILHIISYHIFLI